MPIKPNLIICGEPNSIFSEIIFKAFKKYKAKKPIVLIGSYNLILAQFKYLGYKIKLNLIKYENNKFYNLKKKSLNIINVDFKFSKSFERISSKSNLYIYKCFETAFLILRNNKDLGLINGPISKKFFLKKKYPGITEFISKSFKVTNFAMLIYNKDLAVSPITTHLPLNKVTKNIKKDQIVKKTLLINNFYRNVLSKKTRFGLTGVNPHCENFFNVSEEKKIIEPAIKILKNKKINIKGPFPADTIFLRQNTKKFDVIIGMYHDQVLAPIKALHGFNAINITLGLPFLRISPDHGPNYEMIGKNKSDPQSLIDAIKFLDKIK